VLWVSGISARIAVSAVSMIGRNRRTVALITASQGDSPARWSENTCSTQ
jgi:hypothetical protein